MARHVRGSDVQVNPNGSSGGAFIPVGCLIAIQMPMLRRGDADVTCLNQTVDFYRDFIKGFKESGVATFKLRFEPADYSFVKTIFEDDDCDKYPIWKFLFGICPGDPRPFFRFTAMISELGMPEKSVDGDNTWEADISLKIKKKALFFTNVGATGV